MKWLWDTLLKPLFKGVAGVLSSTFKWAFSAPITSIAVGFGALLAARLFKHREFLAGTFSWIGGLLISTGATGYVYAELAEATKPFRQGQLRTADELRLYAQVLLFPEYQIVQWLRK